MNQDRDIAWNDQGRLDGASELDRIHAAVVQKERIESDLRRSRVMEAVGALASGVAHDFNNLLYIILGYAELAQDSLPEEDPTRKFIDEIIVANRKASDLVKRLQSFSRGSDADLASRSIEQAVNRGVKSLRKSLPEGVEIVTEFDGSDAILQANESAVTHLSRILITNAVEALEGERGRISVSLKRKLLNTQEALGRLNLRPGPYLVLEVKDTGRGMETTTLDRIFDPYFTTKTEAKGAGLGLTMAFGIVRNHRGQIDVTSRFGEGTRVRIYFPLNRCGVNEDRSHLEGDERILLVDDDRLVCEIMKNSLEKLGYRVTLATSGHEAIGIVRENPAAPDLVVTDQVMPNLTGIEVARAIREIRPDLPVILCTGFSDSLQVDELAEAGIREMFLKPVVIQDLALAVRKHVKTVSDTIFRAAKNGV